MNVWTLQQAQMTNYLFSFGFGGRLQVGYTSEMEFDGERIARRRVVVVTAPITASVQSRVLMPIQELPKRKKPLGTRKLWPSRSTVCNTLGEKLISCFGGDLITSPSEDSLLAVEILAPLHRHDEDCFSGQSFRVGCLHPCIPAIEGLLGGSV